MPDASPSPPNDSLTRLLSAVQTRSTVAWEEFVGRYERLVWSVPRRMGYSEADSADIVQSTWLLVWRHLQHIQHPKALTSWLITTTVREAGRFGRKERQAQARVEGRGRESLSDEPQLELADFERLEKIQLVRDAIGGLETRCADLLGAIDLAGQSYQEAAKRLSMPVGSVGPTRIRCLARLREELVRRGLQ